MEIINYTDFRTHLKSNLDKVSNDKETVIVARNNNNNVVLISLDEYNSFNETIYLMKSANNRERLIDSIAEFEAGVSHIHNLFE